jgi:hypothetical protein
MFRHKPISNRLLLGVIFAGLNLLCFLGIAHGRHVVHYTKVNYSHVPAHGMGRSGSRSGRAELIAAVDAVIDHAVIDHAPQTRLVKAAGPAVISPQAALVAVAFSLPQPEDRTELLARENVLALGSAPRAPGLGRGPPAV